MRPSKNLLRKLRLRHLGKSEEGQALVLAGLALVTLVMMAGLGVDIGYLRYQKGQMQKAADAGALAAASALLYNGNYVNAATSDTGANGFTPATIVNNGFCSPSGTTICVAVNSPPLTPGDPFLGAQGYVEVIVNQPQSTFFLPIAGYRTVNVTSRAVATSVATASGCVYATDPNDDAATLVIDSGASVSAPSCAMYVESNSSNALQNNSGNKVTGSYIGVVGTGVAGSDFSCQWNAPGAACPQTSMAQFVDPLSNLPAPAIQPGCQQKILNGDGSFTFPAGTYCNGISIPGITTIGPGAGKYYFGPGLITVEGGMSVSNNALGYPTLISNSGGTLFYLTGPNYTGLNIGAGVNVQLNPETTGAQAGILFFQDRSIPVQSPPQPNFFSGAGNNTGSGQNNYSGVFYFPTTKLSYAGRVLPSLANSIILVAWQVEFTGSAQLNAKVPASLPPLGSGVLVE